MGPCALSYASDSGDARICQRGAKATSGVGGGGVCRYGRRGTTPPPTVGIF